MPTNYSSHFSRPLTSFVSSKRRTAAEQATTTDDKGGVIEAARESITLRRVRI